MLKGEIMEKEKIINGHIKTYLVGSMERCGTKDNGRGWRDKIRPELENRIDSNKNPVYVFDPTLNEELKVGFPTKEFHRKLEGWVASGNRDLVREKMDIIWRGKSYLKKNPDTGEEELKHILGDIDYVRNSNFIILHIHEKDKPCGTFAEAFLAFERKIPIYMIQTMPLSNYNKSLLGWVLGSNGEIFPNQKQLLAFIDKKYKLKVLKNSAV